MASRFLRINFGDLYPFPIDFSAISEFVWFEHVILLSSCDGLALKEISTGFGVDDSFGSNDGWFDISRHAYRLRIYN
tara:strand:- start:3150 stop:3380 length:231 start_codon:yes stop_codon:yes gene_type:complete